MAVRERGPGPSGASLLNRAGRAAFRNNIQERFMAVRLCWWDSKNFGDALNPYLFKSIGYNVKFAQSDTAEVIAVGSYMERLLVGALFDRPQSLQPIAVWGTGFQFEPGRHLWFKDIRQPEEFIRPVDIRALRGKLSQARAEAITKQDLGGIALGDPGLLTGRIIDTRGVRKQHRLGVFCHFTDNDNRIFDRIIPNVRDSIRIDVEASVIDIVKAIASCEAIISSAMHPLIIADSLRVPNLWINVSENAISKYKFDDYYSVFGIKPQFFDLNRRLFGEGDLEQLHADYAVTDEQVEAIQDGLMRACPLPGKIRYLSYPDILAMRVREAVDRDKVFDRSTQHIGRTWRNCRNVIRRIARRPTF
jgi:pyruvyltransferase